MILIMPYQISVGSFVMCKTNSVMCLTHKEIIFISINLLKMQYILVKIILTCYQHYEVFILIGTMLYFRSQEMTSQLWTRTLILICKQIHGEWYRNRIGRKRNPVDFSQWVRQLCFHEIIMFPKIFILTKPTFYKYNNLISNY